MTVNNSKTKATRHKRAMEKQKTVVDSAIAAADTDRGVALLLTGDGKGKSSSAFGMVLRALGYHQKVGVVQFIKGEQLSGEEIYLRDRLVEFGGVDGGYKGVIVLLLAGYAQAPTFF